MITKLSILCLGNRQEFR